MNGTRTPSILPALLLLLASPLAAGAQTLERVDLGRGSTELRGFLPVRMVCTTCTEDSAPQLGALWRTADGIQERRTLRTRSWAEGLFEWVQPDGRLLEVEGELLEDGAHGWLVRLPLEGSGAPFRLQAQLDGYTAPRLAYWPERDPADAVAFDFVPVAELLEEHPEWSVERTHECDVLVPRELGQAVTFFVAERPVAWLYGADGAPWTFQFVRPGGTLLDRVTIPVQPSDEGSHLGFRLPLAGLLGFEPGARIDLGTLEGHESGEGLPVTVTVGAAGVVDLDDCPRIPVEIAELELETY